VNPGDTIRNSSSRSGDRSIEYCVPEIPRNSQLFSTEAELEALAALEHERWNAQRRLDGWRWADLPAKDDQRRLHPALAPYDGLSATLKSYDRALVEETQAICWAALRLGRPGDHI